jgi:hypothetical protein
MNARETLLNPGSTHELATSNDGTADNANCPQVGNRNLESADRLDGHGLHASDTAGEAHQTADRCVHRLTNTRFKVNAPMTAVLTGRRIRLDDLAFDRCDQTDCGHRQDCEQHSPPSPNRIGADLG